MEDFIHLHVHSQYSLLDGQASIQKMVEKAIGNEMRGMALTDHGNMFGVKDFFDCCNSVNKKRKKEGLEPFKPIFGCEVYVARRKKEQMSDPTISRACSSRFRGTETPARDRAAFASARCSSILACAASGVVTPHI